MPRLPESGHRPSHSAPSLKLTGPKATAILQTQALPTSLSKYKPYGGSLCMRASMCKRECVCVSTRVYNQRIDEKNNLSG